MGAPRWPIAAVGVAALASALGWFLSRPGAPVTRPQPPAAPGSSAGLAAVSAPAGPALAGSAAPVAADLVAPATGDPAAGAQAGVASPAAATGSGAADPPASDVAFSAQVRDPAWAGATEQTIQRRLAAVKTLRKTECRRDTCELTLGGSTEAIADTLAALEGRAGLRDLAAHVLLTAPETQDGVMTLRAYVSFER